MGRVRHDELSKERRVAESELLTLTEDAKDSLILKEDTDTLRLKEDADTLVLEDDENTLVLEDDENTLVPEDDENTLVPDEDRDTLILDENVKNDIVIRLRRIEGQARGVQKMVKEGRPCEDIIIQVAALKAAVTQAGVAIAGSHLVECVARSISSGEGDCRDQISSFAKLFSKLT